MNIITLQGTCRYTGTLEGTYDQLGPGEISTTLTRQDAGCGRDEQIQGFDYDVESKS